MYNNLIGKAAGQITIKEQVIGLTLLSGNCRESFGELVGISHKFYAKVVQFNTVAGLLNLPCWAVK